MRGYFPYRATHNTLNETNFRPVKILWDNDTPIDVTYKQSLFFRLCTFIDPTPGAILYVTRRLEFAEAIVNSVMDETQMAAAHVVMYKNSPNLDNFYGSTVLNQIAAVPPDFGANFALVYHGNYDVTGAAGEGDAVWAYTDNPATLVVGMIESILEDYTGEGKSLEEFDTAQLQRGPRERSSRQRQILVTPEGWRPAQGTRQWRALDVDFTIYVCALSTEDHGRAAQDECMRVAGACQSVLSEENRTLDGVALNTIITSVGPPELRNVDSGNPMMVAEMTGFAQVRGMRTDE